MNTFRPCQRAILMPAIVVGTILAPLGVAIAQGGVSVGDMVLTGVNGQHIVGEVAQVHGAMVDLNLGQNQLARFVSVQDLKMLQRVGSVPQAHFGVGDTVRVPYLAGTVMSGRIMKVNGGYCEIDSSQSGFTGWSKCSELGGGKDPSGAAAGGQGAAAAATSKPPKPGFASCAGKIEGRYGSSLGAPVSIVFRSGKATLKDPGGGAEEMECWLSGKSLILRDPQLPNEDMPIDINDDGTLDTPLGELKKKGS
jgi:hypothetical protein